MDARFIDGLLKMVEEEYMSDAVLIGREYLRVWRICGRGIGTEPACSACALPYIRSEKMNWTRCPNPNCEAVLSCGRGHCHIGSLESCNQCRTAGCRYCISQRKCPSGVCGKRSCYFCEVLCCHCERVICKSHMKYCTTEYCGRYTCFECLVKCEGCRDQTCPATYIMHTCTFV